MHLRDKGIKDSCYVLANMEAIEVSISVLIPAIKHCTNMPGTQTSSCSHSKEENHTTLSVKT